MGEGNSLSPLTRSLNVGGWVGYPFQLHTHPMKGVLLVPFRVPTRWTQVLPLGHDHKPAATQPNNHSVGLEQHARQMISFAANVGAIRIPISL